ncbi:MAG TPA: hypothetical protein VFD84_17935 [Candidatus Binatia bacterium]|nr:hypothetical protein [Candidatus Binatia bacterium]
MPERGAGADVAITRRDDLVRDQLAHLPYGSRATAAPPVRVGATGTGESLLVLAWTADELARERAAGAAMLAALGVAPGMRVANALPGALATPGSLLLGDVVEELGALDVPLGHVDGDAAARAAWELFDRVQADVLVVDAPSAPRLFAAAPAAPRPWWRGVVWLAVAPATPAPVPVPDFGGWQRTWVAVPEVTSFFAHSCAEGAFHAGAHVAAEVVDGEAVVATPGAGRVRRYATGLRARLRPSCACGAGGVALEVG